MKQIIEKLTDILVILIILMDLLIGAYALHRIIRTQTIISEVKILIETAKQPIVIGTTNEDVIIIGDPKKIQVKQSKH